MLNTEPRVVAYPIHSRNRSPPTSAPSARRSMWLRCRPCTRGKGTAWPQRPPRRNPLSDRPGRRPVSVSCMSPPHTRIAVLIYYDVGGNEMFSSLWQILRAVQKLSAAPSCGEEGFCYTPHAHHPATTCQSPPMYGRQSLRNDGFPVVRHLAAESTLRRYMSFAGPIPGPNNASPTCLQHPAAQQPQGLPGIDALASRGRAQGVDQPPQTPYRTPARESQALLRFDSVFFSWYRQHLTPAITPFEAGGIMRRCFRRPAPPGLPCL